MTDRTHGFARRTPISTYRLQLGPDLGFDDAAARVGYLSDLGVTDLYLSPVLAAAPGSTHGYDVIDHGRLSDVMGGRPAFERLVAAARAHDLGVIVDVVPNHMAVPTPASLNRVLWSVLAQGPESPYASWFDVDLGDGAQVLMPVLGRRLGAAMADGELTVSRLDEPESGISADEPVLCYFEHRFPIRPGTEHLPLAELLERQHYRLAYWRVADEELNYRRFFDVGSLVAVRVERPEVFDATHALLLELFDAGLVDGFRIDHPDGLADPRGYFRRLDERTGGAWTVAEKILEADETLPADWPTAGTTGYDAAWRIGQVLIDPSGAGPLGAVLTELTGDSVGTLPRLTEVAKREIATGPLYAEVHRLSSLIADLCHDDVRLRDHTLRAITDCVTELVVACDRYRAYVVPGEAAPGASENLVREWAHVAATRLEPDRAETLEVVVDLVLGREVGSAGRHHEARRNEVIVRFQQVCGAVVAKGVEDTTFYRWTHLTALCEVGGAPQTFSIDGDELHAWAATTQLQRPATMTAGSTHDNKRGEDVRARIGVLSELSGPWQQAVTALRAATAEVRPADLDGRTENLLWQTLAGTWTADGPITADRLSGYLVKAAREAKTWTSWTSPDTAGEDALTAFVAALLEDPGVAQILTEWVRLTAEPVRAATLATKALQLTLPGVADTYQGAESTLVALVDPDNRGPVAHEPLARELKRLDGGASPRDLAAEKLRLTAAVLRLRRGRPDAFVGGAAGYEPLPTSTGHAVAFARTADGVPAVVTVVTRLSVGLSAGGGWGARTVVLPEGRWRDVLTGVEYGGGSVDLAVLLADSPVAVLEALEPAG
ncbi:malto-oligosyltrehalose synthase [Occultella gossypii]|uniref:Malto-oligosyltrehalose synthase n=1 Tax=Occultella gossypii TaxID=2800820 RepID=A0ABS7S5S3_9MICO|nr:malto-oligosyltrehalose synthase [Occultella gossypii]MBZ2195693.1 malto-oligosyltrehalose synthase [Occultella gossypii]